MAAGNTIEAKLRIAAEVAQAITALKSVRKELLETSKAAERAGGGAAAAGSAPAAPADQPAQQVKRRSAAEREAANERRRIDREDADAAKAKAREAKKLADDEERARRKKERDETAARRQRDAEEARAKRGKSYQSAALAPQINDVFVGLTTGQSPLQVALQQGPQITQIFGGVRNTFAALAQTLTPLRVALGGVAAGFALLAINAAAGYRESSQLNKALALSGNIANTSLGQINQAAAEISTEQKTSIGSVRDVLAEVIKIAGQTDTTIKSTGRAASALAKLTGQSAEEAVKGFEAQAEGITSWAIKANRSYNFLTASQMAYIRSLEQQGRVAEAIRFTNEQLAQTLESRSANAIGIIERAWNAAGRAVSFFLDQLKKVGRDPSAEERLQAIGQRLAELDARAAQRAAGGLFAGRRAATDEAERAALEAERASINRDLGRKAEAAAASREEQDRIKREAKEFAQIIAGQNAAEAQKRLAQREAELDAERSLVERSHAQERTSAADQALQLNAIDQKRAQARQALAERLLAIEQARTPSLESKADVEAQKAQLTQLQAQLIAARAAVATAVAQGRTLIDAEISRLDEELRRRQADNLATRADRTQDPQERARLAAEAATAQARKELADLERDIRSRQQTTAGLAGSEGLQARNDAVLAEARKSLAELTRRAQLDSILQQTSEVQQALALLEQQQDQLVEQGALTTEEAEQRKLDARARALPQLKALLAIQAALAQTPGEQNAVTQLVLDLDRLGDKTTEVERTMRASIKGGFKDLFVSVLDGSKSALQGVKDFASGVAKAMLNILAQRWAEKLANSLFGNGGGAGGGNGGFDLASFFTSLFATVKHSGGLISASGGVARAVSPLVFAGAQVLHSGGLVQQAGLGLRKNEVPVIAEVGEEMLTADNPRHIKNYRGNGVVVNASFTVNGATGAETQQLAELEALQQMMTATVEAWAAKQRRQGGMLAGVARG